MADFAAQLRGLPPEALAAEAARLREVIAQRQAKLAAVEALLTPSSTPARAAGIAAPRAVSVGEAEADAGGPRLPPEPDAPPLAEAFRVSMGRRRR